MIVGCIPFRVTIEWGADSQFSVELIAPTLADALLRAEFLIQKNHPGFDATRKTGVRATVERQHI